MTSKKDEHLQQPRALLPDLEIGTGEYRASLYAELQKFKDPKRTNQLYLDLPVPLEEQQIAEEIEITGLDFTVSQDKALSALQSLLDKTGYQGNLPGTKITRMATDTEIFLPTLHFTPGEYLEAYGLTRSESGRYGRNQRDEALAALYSLAQDRVIIYKRAYMKGNHKRYKVIREKVPLIRLLDYADVAEEHLEELESGQPSDRVTKIVIQPAPILVEHIESFFLLKSPNLHQEIESLAAIKRGKKARVPRAFSLLIEWLLTLNISPIKVAKETLADRVRLDYLIKQRKMSKAEEILKEGLEIAQEAGYLLKWSEDLYGRYVLVLNPERCKRISRPLEATPEEEEQ